MSELIEIRDVSKVYRRDSIETPVLNGINPTVKEGEFLALMGPSGSGKTTLLNMIAGIDKPTSGQIRVADTDIAKMSESALARWRASNVGFVFQFYNLIPSLTALENVALVTEIAENPMDPEEALRRVGLTERQNHFPSQLSGGEQQRVAIARAIAKNPDILLCDEPTGALDFPTAKLVLDVLARINEEMHTLVAVITHNTAIAAMADRVIRLRSGEIVEVTRNARKARPEELVW